jgi:hypothetical protein
MLALDNHPLADYFRALDAGDYEACSALFAQDAIYIRPRLLTADSLVVTQGRGNIREYLRRRGKLHHHHRILFAVAQGHSCFIEGRGGGDRTGIYGNLHGFLAHATFDHDGLIKRYLAVLTMPDADDMLDKSIGFDNAEFKP